MVQAVFDNWYSLCQSVYCTCICTNNKHITLTNYLLHSRYCPIRAHKHTSSHTHIHTHTDDGLRLRCPSCTTSFLNIPPEKLLLGTSTFQMDPPAYHHNTVNTRIPPSGSSQHGGEGQVSPDLEQQQQQQQQQQGREGQKSHSSSGSDPLVSNVRIKGVAPMTLELRQLQQQREEQQAVAQAFAWPFPIHCVVDEQDVLEVLYLLLLVWVWVFV